jgi:hypothetical protein
MGESFFGDQEDLPLEGTEQPEDDASDVLDDDLDDEETPEPDEDTPGPGSSRSSRAQRRRQRYESRIRELEEQVGIVQQFRSDPHGTMRAVAQQLGYELRPASQDPSTPSRSEVPRDVLQMAEQALREDNPDLAFMAPALAKVAYQIAKQTVEPVNNQTQALNQTRRAQEYREAVDQLESEYPEWRTHETEMSQRLDFLKSALNGGPMVHPKYGNVLNILYGWSSGDGRAIVAAARRMSEAARNRVSTGVRQTRNVPDVQAQIKKAKSRQDKMRIALNASLGELGLQ